MTSRDDKVEVFRALHRSGCFVLPNPWDGLSARILEASGHKALATTSFGYAFAAGKKDGTGQVSRDETLRYAADIAQGTDLPVTADTEDCYAETPTGVAETVALAAKAGLAGLSIEDSNPSGPGRFRDYSSAVERVEAAAEAARRHNIVLTARADGMIRGDYDLNETIRRLQAFEAVGAEVVYAPGLPDLDAIAAVCQAVQVPVNHVLGFGAKGLSLQAIAGAGVRRISLGGSFTRAACSAVRGISDQILDGDFSAIDAARPWGAIV